MTVTGLREAQDRLGELGNKIAKKLVKSALRTAAKPTLRLARANAPVKTGLVRRSLRIVSGRGRKTLIQMRLVMGLKNFVGKSYYGAFVEEGHFTGNRPKGLKGLKGADAKQRYHALSVLGGRKFIPGKHFMLHAFEATQGTAPVVFATKINELIAAEVNK